MEANKYYRVNRYRLREYCKGQPPPYTRLIRSQIDGGEVWVDSVTEPDAMVASCPASVLLGCVRIPVDCLVKMS